MIETDFESMQSTVDCLAIKIGKEKLLDLVQKLLGPDVACIKGALGLGSFDEYQAASCIFALCGQNVLTNRPVRSAIVENAFDDDIRAAFGEILISAPTVKAISQFERSSQIEEIVSKAWHPGSPWSLRFCTLFGLPTHLAGEPERSDLTELTTVDPFLKLNPLHDFQTDLRNQIVKILGAEQKPRALVALPTGAGKTRLMVETMLELQNVERGSKKLVWIAQHNELCEQAVQCFAQVWAAKVRPRNRRLIIQRVWKGQSADLNWDADVFVGTVQSLEPRLARSTPMERSSLAATIIDEAHHALGQSYASLFAQIGEAPILGITATPGSSQSQKTEILRRRFGNRVLLADELGDEPIETLQALGILARPNIETVETKVFITSKDFALDGSQDPADLSSSALERLGSNVARNQLIINRLLNEDEHSSVLCFAPSVRSARAIAAGLAMAGRRARSVDADSDLRYRNETVDDFRSGRVQFLVNYGVLATGFDAPKVDLLILARPTTSPVLYEQMIGRGLRGPQNGGTATCTVLHFEDDFSGFGGIKPMSYARFLEKGTS